MYAIGDTVFYGAHGICKIKDIQEQQFHGTNQPYYTLKSALYPSMILYHPVHTKDSRLKKIISKEYALQIIDCFRFPADEWQERNTARSQLFKAAVASADHLKIAQFLNTILRKQLEITEQSKKLAAQDTQMMQQVSTILFDELSLALNIPKDKITKQIEDIISKN